MKPEFRLIFISSNTSQEAQKMRFIFCLTMLIACTKGPDREETCLKKVLEQERMVAYSGQAIGCNSFLELYKFDGQQYFVVNNHCADMVILPFDCDGKRLCEKDPDAKGSAFYETAELIRIVGIKI